MEEADMSALTTTARWVSPCYTKMAMEWRRNGGLELAQASLAGLPEGECPVCHGNGYVSPKDMRYSVPCPCVPGRRFAARLDHWVPKRLQGITLKRLEPYGMSPLPGPFQAKEIAGLKASPDRSYLFLGPAGTSKTTYATALFIRHLVLGAFQDDRECWRAKGLQLFEAAQEWSMAKDKQQVDRIVTPADIRDAARGTRYGDRCRRVPVLLLEEIDKVGMTESRANVLFGLVDELQEHDGILLMTTNLTPAGFRAKFLESEHEAVRAMAEPFLRRILDSPEAVSVRNYHGI